MKFLYIHQHFSTPNGAAGTRSYEMARRLLVRGHQVTMVCGSYDGGITGLVDSFKGGKRRGMVDGIDVIEFNLSYSNRDRFITRGLTFIKFALATIGIALTEKYDVIFATTTPLTAGIPGICARWIRGKPFVFEVRDLWPELPRAMGIIRNPIVLSVMSALEWVSYRSADRLVGLSPGIVEGIVARGVKRANVCMVPNGCDVSLFSSTTASWRPHGVRASDLLAVFAGTHGPANGLDAVLDAAAVLKARGRDNIKILLIGQGKLKKALVARARDAGLDNVVFHAPVSKVKLAQLMAAADIGLQTLANVPAFYYGTSPNKFFDYLAAGRPVLNNYPGWLADLIRTHGCGFAVPPDNPIAFADALEAAAENREALREMGQAARKLAEQHFDRSVLSKSWATWLEAAPFRSAAYRPEVPGSREEQR